MKTFTLKRITSLLILTAILAIINFEAFATQNNSKFATVVTAPLATSATNIGSASFQANWNSVKGVDGYLLYVYIKSGKLGIKTYLNNYNPKPIPGVQNLDYSVSDLNMNTTYYYEVKAVIGMEASPVSNEISLTTLLTAPDAPVASAATNITTTSFQANWQVTPSAAGYKVTLVNDDEQSYVQIEGDIDDGNVTSLNITGLDPETSYNYQVQAVNSAGTSGFSNMIHVNTFGAPVAPVAKAASNITTTSFQANWEIVPGATGYLLTVGNDFEQDYVQIDGAITGGDVNSFEVTGLDPDIPYTYLVKAVNAEGTSLNSNMISLTTLAYRMLILSANPAAGGVLSGDGTFDEGTTVNALAKVNKGYSFVNWTENGIEVSTKASYSFDLNSNRTLVANFQLATGLDDDFKIHIRVWPNPISTLMHIAEIPLGSTIQITSLLGRLELEKTNCKSMETLNLAALKNGVYILTLKNKLGTYTRKIIKQ